VSGSVAQYFEPASLADLVRIVEDASREGHQIRVVGSGWSFEDAAYSPEWMVNLKLLNKQINTVTDTSLNQLWTARQSPGAKEALFHVEAGITIARLNKVLEDANLAMPTLGGANGQTLAGAISTGTHGGDIMYPPLNDAVMAMHVVTMGGRECWIERASDPITNDLALAPALECGDAEIIRDDGLFSAVLVGLGRFGIIYSYILRVTKAFRLAEWTTKIPTIQLITLLTQGIQQATFLRPLFSSLPAPPPELGAEDISNPRGLEVVFDSQNLGACWIKRRWLTNNQNDLNASFEEDSLCKKGAEGVKNEAIDKLRVASSLPFIRAKINWLEERYSQDRNMWPGDMLGLVLQALWDIKILYREAESLGEVIRNALAGPLGREAPQGEEVFNLGKVLIPGETARIFEERYRNSAGPGRRGPSHLIISGHPEDSNQVCYRALSIEPIFDARTLGYLNFLQTIINAAPNIKQAGYFSLRWSAKSSATLSMHNIKSKNAVAIEITSLRGLPDNQAWMAFIHQQALAHGGRPHWGQINKLSEADVISHYGDSLTKWKDSLQAFAGGASIFSGTFTRQRGLEPSSQSAQPTMIGQRVGDLRARSHAAISLLL
jgi:hypothetical protein